jgi:hypothetical protein
LSLSAGCHVRGVISNKIVCHPRGAILVDVVASTMLPMHENQDIVVMVEAKDISLKSKGIIN